MTRRKHTAASLAAFVARVDDDDRIPALLQQARERGLPLCVASDPSSRRVHSGTQPASAATAAVGDVAPPPRLRFFRRVDARNSAPQFARRRKSWSANKQTEVTHGETQDDFR